MGAALDAFRHELDRADEFTERARLVGQKFENEAIDRDRAADKLIIEANGTGTPPDRATSAAAEAIERQAEAQQARLAKAEWEDDILRTYVLRLVTAFEVFLRQFIIEKASTNPSLLHRFLSSRIGLDLDCPILFGNGNEALDRIANCVDRTCESFSNIEEVNSYFKQWFGKGFLSAELSPVRFAGRDAKSQAIADMRILFQLRHILVHKSGMPNTKYHAVLTGEQCRQRLDTSVLDVTVIPYQAAPPDVILSSPAKYAGYSTKKDDFYLSLLSLAEHIDAALDV